MRVQQRSSTAVSTGLARFAFPVSRGASWARKVAQGVPARSARAATGDPVVDGRTRHLIALGDERWTVPRLKVEERTHPLENARVALNPRKLLKLGAFLLGEMQDHSCSTLQARCQVVDCKFFHAFPNNDEDVLPSITSEELDVRGVDRNRLHEW